MIIEIFITNFMLHLIAIWSFIASSAQPYRILAVKHMSVVVIFTPTGSICEVTSSISTKEAEKLM